MATQDDGYSLWVGGGQACVAHSRDVPQPGGAVPTAGDQPVAVRADGHGADPILMAAQDGGRGGRIGGGRACAVHSRDVPQPGSGIIAAGDQPTAVGADGGGVDGIRVAAQNPVLVPVLYPALYPDLDLVLDILGANVCNTKFCMKNIPFATIHENSIVHGGVVCLVGTYRIEPPIRCECIVER